MTVAVEKYLTLTEQINVLRIERDALKVDLPSGRTEGLHKDIYVGMSNNRTLSINLLKKYVSEKVIDLCSHTSRKWTYRVVDKLKPKKIKVAK